MVKRYDVHPNVHYQTLTQPGVDTTIEEEATMFEPVPLGKNKVMIAELLKVVFDHDGAHAGTRLYTLVVLDGVTEKLLARTREQFFVGAAGTEKSLSVERDLTDGQGNGVLLCKNPLLRYSTSTTGAASSGYFTLYWRYKEITNTELVQMLGGI